MSFIWLLLKSPKFIFPAMIFVGCGLVYLHYTNLLKEIDVLKTNSVALELTVQTQKKTVKSFETSIDSWEKSQKKLIAKMEELKNVSKKASKERVRLEKMFSKHDIGKIALRKPGLLEKRINNGIVNAIRMLESATKSGANSGASGDKTTGTKAKTPKSSTNEP